MNDWKKFRIDIWHRDSSYFGLQYTHILYLYGPDGTNFAFRSFSLDRFNITICYRNECKHCSANSKFASLLKISKLYGYLFLWNRYVILLCTSKIQNCTCRINGWGKFLSSESFSADFIYMLCRANVIKLIICA